MILTTLYLYLHWRSVPSARDPTSHVWEDGNVLVFDSRSSWGAPKTLSFRLVEAITDEEGQDKSLAIDGSGNFKDQEDVGMCWVDLAPMWDDVMDTDSKQCTVSCQVQFLPTNATSQFDEHGELPNEVDGGVEVCTCPFSVGTIRKEVLDYF